jgi:hypothetical protein
MKTPSRLLLAATCALVPAVPVALAGAVALPAARDATLIENAGGEQANGAGPVLFAGRTNQAADSIRRGLLAFDVAGRVPQGALVTAVSLILHHSSSHEPPSRIGLHRLQDDWGEGAASASGGSGAAAGPGDSTWLHRFHNPAAPASSPAWERPGGDFAALPSATADVGGVGYYNWYGPSLARDVQLWLDDPARNHGWILVGDENAPGDVKRFDSRENPDAALRPLLLVEFVGPGDRSRK